MKIVSKIKENLALGYPLSRKKTLHHLESVFLGLWTPLGSDLGGNLGPTMEPQIHKNLLKSTFEEDLKNNHLQNANFWKFQTMWEGFREGRAWRNLAFRPIHPSKSWKSCDVTSHPKKITSKIDFRLIWAPSWAPKSSQKRDKKSLEKWWKNDDDKNCQKTGFGTDFGWILGSGTGGRRAELGGGASPLERIVPGGFTKTPAAILRIGAADLKAYASAAGPFLGSPWLRLV